MALETLKDLKRIGGFEVTRTATNFSKYRPIFIDDETNEIAFQIQNGPIKEAGVNGCQVVTMLELVKYMFEGLNKQFPCRENAITITKLEEALMWQEKRTKDRLARQAEGLSVL